MKTTTVLFAGLFALAAANTEPTEVNAVEAMATPTSVMNATAGHDAQNLVRWLCTRPKRTAYNWYRLTKDDGPHYCTTPPLGLNWAMLRSYRDGGVQNVHWKYTNDENDPECMSDWTYHARDGVTVKAQVPGRTTTYGLNKRWCALPVYNDGGVRGYQWDFCDCQFSLNGRS